MPLVSGADQRSAACDAAAVEVHAHAFPLASPSPPAASACPLALVLQPTYEKLLTEVPKYKMITPSVLADRLRVSSRRRAGGGWQRQLAAARRVACLQLSSAPQRAAPPTRPLCRPLFDPSPADQRLPGARGHPRAAGQGPDQGDRQEPRAVHLHPRHQGGIRCLPGRTEGRRATRRPSTLCAGVPWASVRGCRPRAVLRPPGERARRRREDPGRGPAARRPRGGSSSSSPALQPWTFFRSLPACACAWACCNSRPRKSESQDARARRWWCRCRHGAATHEGDAGQSLRTTG